ncbi:hypothetical protein GCM10029964_027530 [Kibdelosporangium lantanae]
MTIWDRGTYETLKWKDDEVDVVLHGERVEGRFTFFQRGEGWMVRRRGGPQDPAWESLPEHLEPMLATIGDMPDQPDRWAFEFKWDGVRALVRVEGGRLQIFSRAGNDVTTTYPDFADLGLQLGSRQAWLDGEIVAFAGGRPSFAELQKRMHIGNAAQARRMAGQVPVSLLIFDLLHFEGRSLLRLPFGDRRALLEKLELKGRNWYTAPSYPGAGEAVLAASREQGLEGVIAKRIDSRYQPGRSPAWIKITDVRPQEVVIGGWRPGRAGARASWARCCSASPRTTACGSSARSAPGSATPTWSGSPSCCGHWPAGRRRSTASSRRNAPEAPGGWSPSWSARSCSGSGPPTAGCARPCGAGCGRTRPRTR